MLPRLCDCSAPRIIWLSTARCPPQDRPVSHLSHPFHLKGEELGSELLLSSF